MFGGLCSARTIARTTFAPVHVQFRHARPRWSAEVERWVGASIEWGSETNSATLPSEVLQRPIPFADAQVSEVLQSHAARVLAARDSATDPIAFTDAVRSVLRELDRPDEQQVARRLGVSRRTLQRQLQQEGTSFGALLQAERRDAAMALLKEPELTLEEIATRLGFSEASAFHRAFRRWTGETPGGWRKRSRT